jgi:hypothetical protein
MFFPSEAAYEEVRRRQRELREQAMRAQLLARARREAMLAGRPAPHRRNWLARRLRADVARP